MADKKISELTAVTSLAHSDAFPLYDASATATRKATLSTLFGGAYFPNASATDQGATGNSDTIKYAVDTISTDTGVIRLLHNSGNATTTYTLTTSETIPSNITLVIESGAILGGAGTLTVAGNIIGSPGAKITLVGGVAINNADGIVIDGVEFDGDSFGNTSNLIDITGTSKNVEIKNCHFHDSKKSGITIATTASLINIHDNRFEDIGDTDVTASSEGMAVYFNAGASEVRIHNNYITETRGHAAIFINEGDSIQITNNRIENTVYRGIQVYGSTPYSTNIDIIGNHLTEIGGYMDVSVGSGVGCNGIYVQGDDPKKVRIIANTITNVVENGIEGIATIIGNTVDTTGYRYADLPTSDATGMFPSNTSIVIGNTVIDAYFEGIKYYATTISKMVLKNNVVIDPVQSQAASKYGILLQANGAGGSLANCDISDNIIIDNNGYATYGLGVVATGGATISDNVSINNNQVRGTYITSTHLITAGNGDIYNNSFQREQALTTGAALGVSVITDVTTFDTSGGGITAILGSGRRVGQIKTMVLSTIGAGAVSLSVTNHETSDPEVFTFADVDDTLVLMWTGTEWITMVNSGVAI